MEGRVKEEKEEEKEEEKDSDDEWNEVQSNVVLLNITYMLSPLQLYSMESL